MNPLISWTEEQRSAFLYRACADAEAGSRQGELFKRLGGEAEAQAAIWRAQLTARGHPTPAPYRPDLRTQLVAKLIRSFGPKPLRRVLCAMKVRGMAVYDMRSAVHDGHRLPVPGAALERRHRGAGGGGNLRAAVFGINDGLVSNAALILGIAGASPDPRVIVMTGVAGLAAGAFSMAAGEYVSVRSQREVFEHQIGLEREELKEYPEAEAQELALIYVAKGVPQKEATRIAQRIVADPEQALDTLAREELGLNPDALGSPWGAALSSFVSFAIGAIVPLAPFLALGAASALPVALAVTACALFAVGSTLSLFTGKSALYAGARMLGIGAAACAVTFAIGRLAGGIVGG